MASYAKLVLTRLGLKRNRRLLAVYGHFYVE